MGPVYLCEHKNNNSWLESASLAKKHPITVVFLLTTMQLVGNQMI